jgi:hypothetical protein
MVLAILLGTRVEPFWFPECSIQDSLAFADAAGKSALDAIRRIRMGTCDSVFLACAVVRLWSNVLATDGVRRRTHGVPLCTEKRLDDH